MPIPKKPNKRRHKKTKHIMTPDEQIRHNETLRMKRHEQASVIRKKIIDNAGDILNEVPAFLNDLNNWVKYGRMKQDHCHIASADRTMEWILHDTINRVPEVWIRAAE